MLAMILAGGRGSRLHDLTNKVAKPAVSYGGKYRIVDFPLSNCANSGVDVVGVLTQYESIQGKHSIDEIISPSSILVCIIILTVFIHMSPDIE